MELFRQRLTTMRESCKFLENEKRSLAKNDLLRTQPGARFSKAPETFRARKATFSSSVSKNGEVYTPETSCMNGTSVHIKNT